MHERLNDSPGQLHLDFEALTEPTEPIDPDTHPENFDQNPFKRFRHFRPQLRMAASQTRKKIKENLEDRKDT
jgi:hypothetical protein